MDTCSLYCKMNLVFENASFGMENCSCCKKQQFISNKCESCTNFE